MEALWAFSQGLLVAVQPLHLAVMVAGVFVGVVAGAIPGISFVNAMAIALPFTYAMSPLTAMMFLGGIYVGGVFGGSISSLLLNIPGDPDSLPSCWDGYPIAQRDGAHRALSIAITASAIGGLFSALLLAFASPPFARFALTFDQPEFFAATVVGLVSVLAIAKGRLLLSITSLFLGAAIGSVGVDPLYGVSRLTFGLELLDNGIEFPVVMIGLFAIGEVLEYVSLRVGPDFGVRQRARMTILPWRDLWLLRGSIARGTGIGSFIGVVPGAGAAVGALVAYGIERQVNPRRMEFGTGVEDGLAAPEASKNATTGTALIPLLTLGIPGSAAAAIMLAALMLHGVQPGPYLYAKDPGMLYAIFASFALANIFMVIVSAAVARFFGTLMKADPAIICAFILIFSLIGAYGVRNNIADVYMCLAFGVLGFCMRRFGFPTAPMVLGVVLGPLAESYFMTSMANYADDWTIFFTRPKSAVLMALAAGFLLWALLPELQYLRRRRAMDAPDARRARDGSRL
ncbi:MAG: tripartite tricarboxylate transporter permease [Betaproteobacteria bacterium]